MRRIFSLIALALLMVFTSCSKDDDGSQQTGNVTNPENKEPENQVDAMTFAQSLGIGWNLGNSLDAHANGKSNETCWGNGKATQATFTAVKNMGFSSVRIPVTWMGHIGAAPDYTIEEAWMKRVEEVVGYAKKAGLKAIINIHHDGAAGNDYETKTATFPTGVWLRIDKAVNDANADKEIKDKITAVWTQISKRFQAEDEWLVFETFNEIHDGFWGYPVTNVLLKKLNEWNQTALNAIRATGGKNATRYVAIPCYAANPTFAKTAFTLPTDVTKDRLIVAVHSYDPYNYAGAGNESEWGHTGKNTSAEYKESYLNGILNTLQTSFTSKNIPVYIGEFGCVHRGDERAEAFRKYYLEYNIRNMRMHKMPVMIWDNGASGSGTEKFGLINHADGSYIANTDINDAREVVALMVKAWTSDDNTYTLNSIYNRAP